MNSEAGALTMATALPLWGSGQKMEFKQKFTQAGALVLPFQMYISEKGT